MVVSHNVIVIYKTFVFSSVDENLLNGRMITYINSKKHLEPSNALSLGLHITHLYPNSSCICLHFVIYPNLFSHMLLSPIWMNISMLFPTSLTFPLLPYARHAAGTVFLCPPFQVRPLFSIAFQCKRHTSGSKEPTPLW